MRKAVRYVEEISEQPGRERQDGDDREKRQVQPGQVAVRARELAELRLLGDPEDAKRQQAEKPGHEPVRRGEKGAEQFSLRVDIGRLGRAEIEHQHRRRKGENAVAERLDAADVAASEGIVVVPHGATIATDEASRSTRACRAPCASLREQPRDVGAQIRDSFAGAGRREHDLGVSGDVLA